MKNILLLTKMTYWIAIDDLSVAYTNSFNKVEIYNGKCAIELSESMFIIEDNKVLLRDSGEKWTIVYTSEIDDSMFHKMVDDIRLPYRKQV